MGKDCIVESVFPVKIGLSSKLLNIWNQLLKSAMKTMLMLYVIALFYTSLV